MLNMPWAPNGRKSGVEQALDRSQAIIEFTPQGEVLTANANFLKATGYALDEITGRHHRMFCDAGYAQGADYTAFWQALGRGAFQAGEFKRVGKAGQPIWLQASYNPVMDASGRVTRIIKIAADVTASKLRDLDFAGKIAAVDRAQATIEFTPAGDILTANDNFLQTVGYRLEDIQGRHHRMFCDPGYVSSADYRIFWDKLAKGQFIADEFKRVGKGGRIVYIQASYNPILDDAGTVIKVVKFAIDVTASVERRLRNDGIGKAIDGELDQVLTQMNQATEMAAGASSASTETTSIVNSVAAASEELSASVMAIADSMTNARSGVEDVFRYAEEANGFAGSLNESASSMTSVVTLIQNIASQINLLALNATIESARAGDAGRGFAVVASEVKNLANQASSSTKTIAGEITRIQSVSTQVAGALERISAAMAGVLENVAGIASAIEQQGSVTGEISGNMQTAVTAVQEIEETLAQIRTTFMNVSDASVQVKGNVERLVA